MSKFKTSIGDLNTRITFYEYQASAGPLPGDSQKAILKSYWSRVEGVWEKDIEKAKENGTLSDITLKIRDFRSDFIPNIKHYISIDSPFYKNKRYQVTSVKPDEVDKRFMLITAKMVSK